MSVLTAVVNIAAAVVVASGAAKVASPTAFTDLFAVLGLPSSGFVARGVGVLELVIGTWVLVGGGTLATIVLSAAYVVFAGVAVWARSAGAASCGCFGALSAPPSGRQIAINLGAAVLCALGAATGSTEAVVTSIERRPLAGSLYACAIVAGAGLVIAVDTRGATTSR